MEKNFGHSSNILSDFEFKCIPKLELGKVMRKVEQNKKQKKRSVVSVRMDNDGEVVMEKQVGMWGNFCTISPVNESNEREEEEEQENLATRTNNEIFTIYKPQSQSLASSAPLFGPPRKFDIQTLKNCQVSNVDDRNIETMSSSNLSVHIVEEVVNFADDDRKKTFEAKKIQEPVKITTTNEADDDVSRCSSDNDETLHSEMLELCNQIEKVNGSNSAALTMTSKNDKNLNQRKVDEDDGNKSIKKKKNKTENKEYTSEKYSNYDDDKKFDFLYENLKALKIDQKSFRSSSYSSSLNSQVKKPSTVVKNKFNENSSEDSTNNNNVYIPKMVNQMSKNEKRQQQQQKCEEENSSVKMKKKRDVTSPCESNKAQNVVASDVSANEKSQAAESAHFLHLMGKVTAYQEKIHQYIERLQEIINDPPLLEDVNDLNKRQRRATEFTNRFARNHLYQIGRLAEEVRLMPDNPIETAAKVNLLFHAIMQAVQSYLKNVENFIYNSYPDKLYVLVDFIINASKICYDRKLFDKTNVVVVKMLRKAVNMKRFLEMNQRSVAKFETISRQQRGRKLFSRNSYAYENSRTMSDRFSIYGGDDTASKPKRPPTFKSKSPYDAPKNPYEIPLQRKASKQTLQSRQKSIRNTPAKPPPSSSSCRSPGVRKSISNISTMVEKQMHDDEGEEENEAKEEEQHLQPETCHVSEQVTLKNKQAAEKPFEEKSAVQNLNSSDEKSNEVSEIMEMLRNIAKERIQEILAPYITDLMPNISTLPPRVISDIKPPRVTADIKPQKPKATETALETVQRIAPNIQYIFIQSNSNESEETLKAEQSDEKLSSLSELKKPSSQQQQQQSEVPKTKVVTSILKPPPLETDDIAKVNDDHNDCHEDDDDDDFLERKNNEKAKIFKEMVMNERKKFAQSMIENPLYVNEQYEEPWKVFGNISDTLVDETLKALISEFDFGEKSYVENFFKHELAC